MYSTPVDLSFSYLRSAVEACLDIKKGSGRSEQNFLPKKLSLSSQKNEFGIRDLRSGIRKKPIPDPGSRGQKGIWSRIRIRNTGCSARDWEW